MKRFETSSVDDDDSSADARPHSNEFPLAAVIAPPSYERNYQAKATMARELFAQGLSHEAVARILHFPVEQLP